MRHLKHHNTNWFENKRAFYRNALAFVRMHTIFQPSTRVKIPFDRGLTYNKKISLQMREAAEQKIQRHEFILSQMTFSNL